MPIYSNEAYPLATETKRIFCAYHQRQFLTNFCQQKQCLMPLCPSCIAQHTEQHFQQGKKPSYTNINQALSKAKQNCYCTIVTLEQYKKLNQDLFEYVSTLQQNIHYQLQTKKNEIFSIITQLFVDYENRLIKQIHEEYEQKNSYSIDQSVNASKFIDEQISNLYEKISLLKGEDCLSSLITYFAVDQQNYKQALDQFDQYFQKNRKAGKIQISIVQDALNNLTNNFCDCVLSVESIIQNFQKKAQENIQSSDLKSKRYGFNKSPINNAKRGSRRTIFDKQNQEINRQQNKKTQNKSQNVKMSAYLDKDMSFNEQNRSQMKKEQPSVKKINGLANDQNLNRRKSVGQDTSVYYSSKRLTRGFKSQI